MTKYRIAGCSPNMPLFWGNRGSLGQPESAGPHPKRHLDQFIRFSTTHGYVQQTDTNHDTSVTIGRIFAVRACDAA